MSKNSSATLISPEIKSEFTTADLELAATLAAQGYEPTRIDGHIGERRFFVFHSVPPAALAQFHTPTSVTPSALFRSFRRLRQLVTREESVTNMRIDHAHVSLRPLR